MAFGLLRLSPQAFWAMTPLEFFAALEAMGLTRRSPLRRDEFAQLMQLFPDRNVEKTNGR